MKKKLSKAPKQKKALQYSLPIILLVIVGALGLSYWNILQVKKITSFEECVAAGYAIKESYPVQCTTPHGKTFMQTLAPTPVSQQVTLKGTLVCLPHKNMNGPHTLECALGFKDEHGNHYGVHDTDPNYKNISQPTGEMYEISGMLRPGKDDKYNSIGTIDVVSLTPQK